MFFSQRATEDIRAFLLREGWEAGDLYPGPEGFYPSRRETPHLHFTFANGGQCYLHWKDTSNQAHTIDSFYIPGCPEPLKTKALNLKGMLTG